MSYEGCKLDITRWADGDSFRVIFPNGEPHVIRLYGVDCFETDAKEDSLARRLREQRAHFGIQNVEDGVRMGLTAKERTSVLLGKAFTVHTDWAVAPGRSGLPRFYAFVRTFDEKDLTAELVVNGLGWARGIYRRAPDGASRDVYEVRIKGLEQAAALKHLGAWELSAPDLLAAQRETEERDHEKLESEKREAAKAGRLHLRDHPINPNTAPPEALQQLPGIGPKLANRIIEERGNAVFKKAEDLSRVNGIAEKTVVTLRPYLTFE